jgi:hypothetical protein
MTLEHNFITQEKSNFEIFKEMRFNSESLEKVAQETELKCYNQYCRLVVLSRSSCISCFKEYCGKCVINCENCGSPVCKFCSKVKYLKFNDIRVCHLCF